MGTDSRICNLKNCVPGKKDFGTNLLLFLRQRGLKACLSSGKQKREERKKNKLKAVVLAMQTKMFSVWLWKKTEQTDLGSVMCTEEVTVHQTCSYFVSSGPEVGMSYTLLWAGTLFCSETADSTVGRISVENFVSSIALTGIFPWRIGQRRIKHGENSQHLVHTQVSYIANTN